MLHLNLKTCCKECNFWIILFLLMMLIFSHIFAQDYMNQGSKYFFMKDYNNAIKQYNLALMQNPNDSQIYYNIAACYEKLGEVNSAINFYNKALKLQPNFIQAQQALKKLRYRNQSQVSQASQEVLRKANNAFNMKNYDEAIRQYTKIIQNDPKNFTAYYNLAFCHEEKKDYALALNLYEHALTLNYSSVETRTAIKRLQSRLKNQRILTFKTKIEAYLAEKKFEAALEEVNNILAIDPDNGWALTIQQIINGRMKQQIKTSGKPQETNGETQTDTAETTGAGKTNTISKEGPSPTIYLVLGILLVVAAVTFFLLSKHKKRTQVTEDTSQKGVYALLQEYFDIKQTGILSVSGVSQNGDNIQGEVKVLNGNIVDAI